jgi:hypothetical protein
VPNVSHWSILWRAFRLGRWDYTDEGLLDRGHVRFFTPKTITKALSAAGFRPLATANTEIAMPQGYRWVRSVLYGLARHTLMYQYLVVAEAIERNVTKP